MIDVFVLAAMPLPAARAGEAASAHLADGGHWHVYPEMAPAGL